MTPLNDLAAAFTLLTRLPIGLLVVPSASPARAAWGFPIVGAVVGLLAALVLAAAHGTHVPSLMGAVWTLAALLLLTGAIHEDGLADTADGFGGGATPAAKLAIMRDSRIGSFGALALIVSMLVRIGGIAALPPGLGIISLVAVGAVARAGMLVPLLMLPSARPGGLGDTFAAGSRNGRLAVSPSPRPASGGRGNSDNPLIASERSSLPLGEGQGEGTVKDHGRWSDRVFGLVIAAGLCFALLPRHAALLMLLACGVAAVVVSLVAMRQVGGYTGDILGATEQVGEMVALTVLAVA